jgi:hypothetical protein
MESWTREGQRIGERARPPGDGGKRGRRGRLIIRRPKTVVEGGEAVENRGGRGRGGNEEEGDEVEGRMAGAILRPKRERERLSVHGGSSKERIKDGGRK